MKILYGIQGTGNGHLTRSRLIAEELNKQVDVHVDYLFSGREESKYFGMEVFLGDCTFEKGLSFQHSHGGVDWLKTIKQAEVTEFLRAIDRVNVHDYDLILTDYEPITAWAAKIHDIPIVGIGHQYAFTYKNVPKAGNFFTQFGMNAFAGAKVNIGLHWHHFNEPILPPVIDQLQPANYTHKNKVVVYLPAEEASDMVMLLSAFNDFNFQFFTNQLVRYCPPNVDINPISKEKFLAELKSCEFIICNAGFELASEALHLGKRLLVKPMKAQVEQLANAIAMRELGYAQTCSEKLKADDVFSFLQSQYVSTPMRIKFPNVAEALVAELVQHGHNLNVEKLSKQLWIQTVYE